MTTVRPTTTEFAQNAAASSSVSAIASGTSAVIARAPLSSSAPGAYIAVVASSGQKTMSTW